MKKVVKDVIIDTTKIGLVDKETGELLPDDAFGKLISRSEKNEVSINYKEYVYLDTARLNYLVLTGIKTPYLGLFLKLVPFSEMVTNKLIQENGKPHTSGTLAKALGLEPQSSIRSLKRLIKLNLVALHQPAKRGEKKFYCLNPFLVRRGKTSSKLLLELFNDPLPKATDAWK